MTVSSDTLRLSVSKETTSGTPSAGVYDLFRTTGEGLTYEVNTQPSATMGGINRGIKDSILTGATVTGDISFELSKFKALEDLLAGCFANEWAGDPISVPGIGADKLYEYSNLDTFSIEKRFTLTDAPTYSYHLFSGCMVDTLTLTITPNVPITGSFGFSGNEMTTETTEAGSSYTSAGEAPIMTAPLVTGIELLSPAGIDDTTGAPLGTPVAWSSDGCWTNLELSFNNNGRAIACIGTLGAADQVLGQFGVTGTGSLYYAGDEPLDALIDQTEYGMRVTMTDEDGESYEFLFTRVKLTQSSVLASGTNTDVMNEMSIQMLEYQGDDYAVTCILSRSSAA